MYAFTDTNVQPGAAPLPAEAMSYGGVYLEHMVEGYRTLYVNGREKISAYINYDETQTMDGASFRNMRYEPRTLTVGFQLHSASPAAMVAAYNTIVRLLSQKQARIIFADEPDKYFVGTKTKIMGTPPGRLAVTGEIEIFCADPFKYSVEEFEAGADSNGVIAVDYSGTYPAHPILTAQSEGHDNGFYGFSNLAGLSLRVGDPDERDQEEVPSDTAVEIINTHFGTGQSHPWGREYAKLVYGYYTDSIGYQSGNGYIYSLTETPVVYDYFYGSKLGYNFEEPVPHFELSFTHWFEPSGTQGGGFDFYINNANGDNICGVSVWRYKGGNIQWAMIAKGRGVKTGSYAIANNPFKSVWRTQTITKIQDTLTFNFGGVVFSLTDPDIAEQTYDAANASFIFYTQPGAAVIGANNALKSVLIRGIPNTWREIANKIPKNGLVEIDTGSGDIYLNGTSQPGLGTVENDFEGFVLEYGTNQISCGASDWVDDAVYKMRYREVYL